MYQLSDLSPQDWFHESCCNLREQPTSREPTPVAEAPEDDADAGSEASSSGLPPPLISAEDYDSFVCGSCVSNIPVLKKYAGSHGAMMVARDSAEATWRRLGDVVEEAHVTVQEDDTPVTGSKRPPSSSETDAPEAKRPRGPSTTCLSPPVDPLAAKVFQQTESDQLLGTGDVFLTDGFRERWCMCSDVSASRSVFICSHLCHSVSPRW